uniref:C-type lectin domain-containing protein n=1 Tax=Steinernema glaseri TaxID=37863 RepID=A0A1I7ZG79_9BILA
MTAELCAKAAYEQGVKAISVDQHVCQRYTKITALQKAPSAETQTFLLDTSDRCSRNATTDFYEASRTYNVPCMNPNGMSFLLVLGTAQDPLLLSVECKEGWWTSKRNSSVVCYYAMKHSEYKNHYSNLDNLIYACKKAFPFADAASIHSAEEAKAIQDHYWKECGNVCGYKIGLVWKTKTWTDGTPYDYDATDVGQTKNYCADSAKRYSREDCAHMALYWDKKRPAFNTDCQLLTCQCDSMFIDHQNFADSSCDLLDICLPCALANNDVGEKRLIPGGFPYLKNLIMRSGISATCFSFLCPWGAQPDPVSHPVKRSNLFCCLPTGSMTQYSESVINQQLIVNLENILDTSRCSATCDAFRRLPSPEKGATQGTELDICSQDPSLGRPSTVPTPCL